MKLYIFEPYDWDYCGGAIGILANSFEEAIDLIVEEDKENAKRRIEVGHFDNITIDGLRTHRRSHFAETEDKFGGNGYNQWLLTSELVVVDNGLPRILFNNWNYA